MDYRQEEDNEAEIVYSKRKKPRERDEDNHVNIQYLGEIIVLDDNNQNEIRRKKDDYDRRKREKREMKNKRLKVEAHEQFFEKIYGAGTKQA